MRQLARALALLVLSASFALASDTDQFGFGARPISMGNAFTALATDWTGAYYNPAAPAMSKQRTIGAGFSYGTYDLTYHSATGGSSAGTDAQIARQTPLSALTLGIASPLSIDQSELLSRATAGIGLFLPTRAIVSEEIETAPGPPQFFLYGARRDKLAVMPFVGIRILPIDPSSGLALCVGGGATLLADISGGFSFDLNSTTAQGVATDLKLGYAVAPNFGAYLQAGDAFSFGLTYRGKLDLTADFDVQVIAAGQDLFPLKIEAVTLFQPQQVAAGIAFDPLSWLTVSADLTYANWRAYNDAFVTIRPVIPQADVAFHDIFVPRVGFESRFDYGIAARAGYYFQKSPIGEQTGATNLVDNDAHVISFGVGWTYWCQRDVLVRDGDGARIEKQDYAPVTIDGFFQWHHLVDQTVEKDPGSSPQTGDAFSSGGDVFNFGIQLTIRT